MTLSKNKIKYLQSLQRKKYRQKYNNFVVEGDKMIREVLENGLLEVEAIFAVPDWLVRHAVLLSPTLEHVTALTPSELKQISTLTTPNEVLAVLKQPDYVLAPEQLKGQLTLYLDDIRDPGNLGTILRIADWFGIGYVVVSQGCVDVFNPKVIQASMGAFQRVRCPELSLVGLMEQSPQTPIYGTAMHGQDIFTYQPETSEAIIVIGNEGQGISAINADLIQQWLTIPQADTSGAESLNAAIATGIICAVWKNKTPDYR